MINQYIDIDKIKNIKRGGNLPIEMEYNLLANMDLLKTENIQVDIIMHLNIHKEGYLVLHLIRNLILD